MSQRIGKRYTLHEQLGRGGMGTVFRATDELTGETVALKRVTAASEDLQFTSHSPQGGTEGLQLALAQEFRTLASLRHPNIISVLDYGFDDEKQPYFTMDYLQAADTIMDAGYSIPVDDRIRLLLQMLQALAYLHRRGIVHRDLKPGNVLVSDARLRVLDFGLAIKSTQSLEDDRDETVGTLSYMAPEVLKGQRAREPADLYAVGIMAFELLTGKHPFEARSVSAMIMQVINQAPDLAPLRESLLPGEGTSLPDERTVRRRIEIPDELPEPLPNLEDALDDVEAIIGQLLAKSPQERYRDAYTVLEDLCSAFGIPLPEESAAVRESFLQAAEFVGREQELTLLDAALGEAVMGHGSTWLISGESGVGKSRLLDELRIRALVRGVLVLRGQAASEGGVLYQLFRRPLSRLLLTSEVDDLDAAILKDIILDIERLIGRKVPDAVRIEGSAYEERLRTTIVTIFNQIRSPAVLILEDLQWADDSLEVLRTLNALVADLPLMIVGSYRHEERPDLEDDLPGMEVIRLERLDSESMAELCTSMIGEPGRDPQLLGLIQRESEGNVYFMIEVLRTLAEEAGRLQEVGATIPHSAATGGIQAVLKRRLQHVPHADQHLLRIAAIAGRELDIKLLRELKPQSLEDWLARCSNSAVLEVQEGSWRFAHDKLRQALLDELDDEERPTLHRELAEAIEQAYPDQVDQAPILALHWREAGDTDKELIFTRRAGAHTLRINQFQEAIEHFNRVLELLHAAALPDDQREILRCDALTRLGEAYQYAADYGRAADHLSEALALARTIEDGYLEAQALNLLGDVAWRRGAYDEATAYCEDALVLSQELDYTDGIGRALNRLGMVAYEQGNYTGARLAFEQSLGASDDWGVRTDATNNLGVVAFATGEADAARSHFEETLRMARQSGERRKAATALLNLGGVAGEQQDLDSASTYLTEALAICREIGESRGEAMVLDNLGMVKLDQQNYTQAAGYFEESLDLAESIGNLVGQANTLVNLGDTARLLDDPADASMYYFDALRIANEIEATPLVLDALMGVLQVWDNEDEALQWAGLVAHHTATSDYTRGLANAFIEDRGATEPGRRLSLDEVVSALLA